jgi:hypothetical protein
VTLRDKAHDFEQLNNKIKAQYEKLKGSYNAEVVLNEEYERERMRSAEDLARLVQKYEGRSGPSVLQRSAGNISAEMFRKRALTNI